MLAVLYANGEGVERNLPLAVRLTCELDWKSPSRMDQLQRMENDPSIEEQLSISDICDSGSGYVAGLCAEYGAQIAEHQREKKLRRLMRGWSEGQKSKFTQLVKAKEDFASASGVYAGHFDGSLHTWYAVDAAESVRKEFFADLEKVEADHLPIGTANDYKHADAELNRVYRQKLADDEDNAAETAKGSYTAEEKKMAADEPENLRIVERTWLKYRDAWIDFAQLRYPSTDRYAWLTLLTKEQTATLGKIGDQ